MSVNCSVDQIMKIIIAALLSPYPYPSPGMTCHRMQYALGLRKLGHQVYFIEEVDPDWCIDSSGQPCDFQHTIRRELFRNVLEPFGFMENACQIYNHGEATFGLSFASLMELSREADLLLNWSGHLKTEAVLENVQRRAYIDQDPVFTQLWNTEYGLDLNFKNHDLFLSAGLNIGTPNTTIPDCGLKWNPILPPVVLDEWDYEVNPASRRFTTVASWSGYGDVSYRGEWYSSKWVEFKRFAELPRRSKHEFEIALKSFREEDEGIQLLKINQWSLTNAGEMKEISDYLAYIRESRAEIGIIQNAYAKGNSGWFGDRWSHYLASGKPVLAQSTGFEQWLPVGKGILTFKNMEEALDGISSIDRDYSEHCRAARQFAEDYLDYKQTLPRMLNYCMS
jgi:hypothetical protein